MVRPSPRALASNGAVPPRALQVPTAARGRLLPEDPKKAPPRETPRALQPDPRDQPDPPSSALEDLTGSAAGAVGRPMLPHTIEAVGPTGEMITLERDEE